MFPFVLLINPCSLALSICTASGVFVHDMQLDKAITTMTMPVVTSSYSVADASASLGGNSHTHTERGSMSEAVQHLRSATTSRMLPREDSRKYVLSKKVVRGVHAFDGYYQPLGEL